MYCHVKIAICLFLVTIFWVNCKQLKRSMKLSPEEATVMVLKSLKFSHLPGIISESHCPDFRTSVIGARIRTSRELLNQTFPVVTAIEFVCGDRIRLTTPADKPLVMEKNVGEWGQVKLCPNGLFATGWVFHLNNLESTALSADEKLNELQTSRNDYSVFELHRLSYITGITLNCSYTNNIGMLKTFSNSSTITFGVSSRATWRMFCINRRVMSGVSIREEAVIAYEGERAIPVSIGVTCRFLTNPIETCDPVLTWERVEGRNFKCYSPGIEVINGFITNAPLTNSMINLTCKVNHVVGVSLNKAITNLENITAAYKPIQLDREGTYLGQVVILKLANREFRRKWQTLYNLQMNDYNRVVAGFSPKMYSQLRNTSSSVEFPKVGESTEPYLEARKKRYDSMRKGNEMQYELVVTQLVGYCSVYKIYFPLLKTQYEKYFLTTIDKIKSQVVFD